VDDDEAIRTMVSSILERRGYVTHTAADGETALERLADGAADAKLVLVDFLMPKMDGLLFCRELRKRFPQRQLGVVLMSGRVDRIKESFVQHSGALDAISKPFDPEALLLVVENVLRRVTEEPAPSAPLFDLVSEGSLATAASSTFEPEPQSIAPGVDHLVLSGDLAHLPIGAVLQLLHMESQNGALIVEGEGRTIIVTLRNGLIDFAQSHGVGDEFRLGRYFVEAGLVSAEEMEDLHAIHDVTKLLGDRLVDMGKVSRDELSEALFRQSSELIYEVLRWRKGYFEFRKRPPSAQAASSHLGIHPAQVVLEGFRRVDEWRVIEARLGHFDQVLVQDSVAIESLGERRLDKSELAVLEAVDGRRSIRLIIAASHRSSFEACRILFQLIEARLVRRRSAT
jgi:CheY-like chemotaxis protein